MNRGEMRTLLRDWVSDTQSTEWSNTRVDRALNRAALQVLIDLSNVQWINLARGTEDFTSVSGTYAYTLSATNAAFLKRMYELGDSSDRAKDIPCNLVAEDARFVGRHPYQEPVSWPFYVTRNHSGSAWVINFLRDPGAGHNFRVEYIVRTSTITEGDAGSDSSEYTQIPPEYHDLVVAKAGWYLCGPDGSNERFTVSNYQMLFNQMTRSASMQMPGETRVDRW